MTAGARWGVLVFALLSVLAILVVVVGGVWLLVTGTKERNER